MAKDKYDKAQNLLKDFDQFRSKYKGQAPEKLKSIWGEVLLMVQMLRAWLKGEYRAPWKTISAIMLALAYLINPFDLIPDLIFGVGLLDDLAVIKKTIEVIQKDLRDFEKHHKM